MNQLKNQRLIIYSSEKRTDNFKNFVKNFERNFSYTTTLYLVLTNKCNLECK